MITVRARDSRQPSTIEAWLEASDTINVSGSASAVNAPILAVYPEEKTSAASAPQNSASAASNSWCSAVDPVTNRDPVEPAPQRPRATAAASTTSGC